MFWYCFLLQIRSVDDFVNKVNSSLRQRQDTERLRGLIIRIESYDVVVSIFRDIILIALGHLGFVWQGSVRQFMDSKGV